MNNAKIKFGILVSLTLLFLGLAHFARADYYPEGYVLSTNLLAGQTGVAQITTFTATATAPANTTVSVNFSTNGTDFYNHNGIKGGWDTLSSGSNSIDLGALDFQTANFYYKLKFTTTDPAATAAVSDVSVVFSDTYTPWDPPWGTGYYPQGTVLSTNLLSGKSDVAQITTFKATTTIPANTTVSVNYSENGTDWYNHNGIKGGWDTLSAGSNSINLGALDWKTANFYYRARFTTSDSGATSTLGEIEVDYSDTYTPYSPPWGSGYSAQGTFLSTDILAGTETKFNGSEQFGYNISSMPSGTTVEAQFSKDGTNWYNSSGTLWGWDTLSSGVHLNDATALSLSTLAWDGATSFYYRLKMTTNNSANTPTVTEAGLLQKSAEINSSALQKTSSTSGLVGYWSFDGQDISGNTAFDRSGSTPANNGTISGAGPVIGKRGQALSFDGTDDYVSMSDNDSLDIKDGDFTLSLWFKADSLSSGWHQILDKSNDWNNNRYDIGRLGTDLNLIIFDEDVVVNHDTYYTPLVQGEWYYTAITIDNTNKNIYAYVNGRLVKSYLSVSNLNNINSASDLTISRPGESWNGNIDEVRIYNRALSPTEIASLYNLGQDTMNMSLTGKNTNGLVGHWTFDGADISGNTAFDRSGSSPANNGTISGAGPVIGKKGQALSFDGSSSYVNAGHGASINNLGLLSFSAWVKPSTLSGTQYILYKGNYVNFGLYGNLLYLSVICSGNNLSMFSLGTIANANQWVHVAVTWDGDITSATTGKFYINGVQSNIDPGGNWGTGSRYDDSAQNESIGPTFNGPIDEVRIYNRALSADEVGDLYRLGQATSTR